MPVTRLFGIAAALGLIAGLPGLAQAEAQRNRLGLVQALKGHSIAYGAFSSQLAGVNRRFRATLHGTVQGQELTVVEKFRFADGATDRKTWKFVPTGPGRWSGTREDVMGSAEVVEDGPVIRLNYVANLQTGFGLLPFSFADVIYRGPNGSLVNNATVSSLGVPVGAVALKIVR